LLLFNYLDTGFKLQEIKSKNEQYNIQSQIEELKDKTENYLERINSTNADTIRELVNEKTNEVLTNELLNKIDNRYSKDFIKSKREEILYNNLNTIEQNIDSYIEKITRNANINLIIGILTTSVAVVVLGTIIFQDYEPFKNDTELIAFFVPRISISLIIEIFSFFFLRLYKRNLDDIKYFENERTNLKLKRIALNFASSNPNEKTQQIVVESLIQTERNFKLAKGESTTNIEKIKLESENYLKIIDKIKEFYTLNK